MTTLQSAGVVSDAPVNEAPVSAVSWAAVGAGAVIAVALSLLMLALGAGLGFASISPWQGDGASAATFSVLTAVWLIVTQWVASAGGGFVTGRLRTKWVGVHTHEVFFRDTAHGFMTWAVATLLMAAIVASGAGALAGAAVRATSTVAAGAAQGGVSAIGSVSGYDVDTLFRTPNAAPAPSSSATSSGEQRTEVTRILVKSLGQESMSTEDRTYLAQLVAARTGLSAAEAEQRVDAVSRQVKAAELKARETADIARKAAATTALFTALSMLIGAFIACVAAALGGRERDQNT